jgi:hypothetical protein
MKNELYYDELVVFQDLNFRKNIEMFINGESVKLFLLLSFVILIKMYFY